jgi:hypothetical protein
MPRNHSIYIPLWERALEAEIGIAIRTNQPQLLRQELYAARKVADRPEFDEVIMFLPKDKDEVFLCRKTVEIE